MILSAAIAVVLVGLFFSLIIVWWMKRPKNLPPGPSALSFVRLASKSSGQLYELYAELANQFGPIFSVNLGPVVFVVLNDGRSIRQALVENALSIHFVPGPVKAGLSKQYRNGSIGFSNGKVFTELTRFCVPALRSFGFGKKSLEPSISEETRCLSEEIKRQGSAPFNFANLSNKATANIICQLVFGRRYEYTDDDLGNALDAMITIVKVSAPSDPAFLLPFLIHTPVYKHLRDAVRLMQDFITDHFNQHKDTFQEGSIRDLIDAYIADDEFSKDYVIEEFWRTILDFFIGGTETTASFLSWAVVFMAAHPDIQRKVQSELDTVVGHGRRPTLDDRSSLPLCDATVMEIQRMCPSLPLSLPYIPDQDVTLGGYNVPKGTIVMPNIWGSHHNPREWDNPEEFRPERFLEEDGRTIKKNSNFLPFGIGRRECMGSQLGKMETFLFFTNLLQQFELSFPPNQPKHSMKGATGLTLWPEPFEVIAVER